LTLHKLRVVLDCANGASYKVAPTVFNELGAETFVLNDSPNGSNINKDCGALYPQNLADEVRRLRADIGFAFDGDADRLVVVDENGDLIDGDNLLASLALHLKEEGRLANSGISATVMSNQALVDFLAHHSIEFYRCDVGDKYVLETMQREGLNFGGEQSGHIILSDFAKTGDGLAASLQVVAYMLKHKRRASQLLRPFEPYPQILSNLKIKNKIPLDEIAGYSDVVKSLEQEGLRTLIRYSGTENLLRVLVEGKDQELVSQRMKELEKFFYDRLNG